MTHRRLSTALTCLLFLNLAVADDWPQFRGSDQSGRSQETGLLSQWPATGPTQLWKVNNLGSGYSTPSISQGKIYVTGYVDDKEVLTALDESTHSVVWTSKIADAERDVGYGHGPRSTPTVDGTLIFTLGAGGHLSCVKASNGSLLWQTNLKTKLDGKMMSGWGFSESVLVDGNTVIATPGGRDGTVAAFNKFNGELIWRTKELKDRAAYASVVKTTIHGTQQYVTLTGDHVAGINPDTGKLYWKAARQGRTAVIPTPIIYQDHVYVTSGYNVGCNLFRISKDSNRFTAEEVYANKDLKNHHGGAIRVGEYIYASSGPVIVCMNMMSGEVAWEERSVGKGALVFADGKLILRSEKGPVALIEANPKEFREISRFDQPERSDKNAWPHPVVANGKLYLRDQGSLFCYDLSPSAI